MLAIKMCKLGTFNDAEVCRLLVVRSHLGDDIVWSVVTLVTTLLGVFFSERCVNVERNFRCTVVYYAGWQKILPAGRLTKNDFLFEDI